MVSFVQVPLGVFSAAAVEERLGVCTTHFFVFAIGEGRKEGVGGKLPLVSICIQTQRILQRIR